MTKNNLTADQKRQLKIDTANEAKELQKAKRAFDDLVTRARTKDALIGNVISTQPHS